MTAVHAVADALERDVRERLFTPVERHGRHAAPRVGAEVELLAIDAASRRPAAIEGTGTGTPGTLDVVRGVAASLGWHEERAASRPHRFRGPRGDALSWEPGGQLELSTRPHASLSVLAREIAATCAELRARASDAGIELVAAGLDPWNPLEVTPLRLHTPRYEAMTSYFRAIGPAGEMMMRQTAALQVNLDFTGDHALQWRVLNAAAPYVVAIFANSPRRAGVETGDRSHRAMLWRALDPSRTGLLARDRPSASASAIAGAPGAAREYLEFALDAGLMMRVDADGRHRTMREWLAEGTMGEDEWRVHLTTLFPEVRPRGFLELRSCDAIDPAWAIAPLALASGIALHPPTTRLAAELLGAPDAALLERAGRRGLRDPVLADVARELVDLALAGCEALGAAHIAPEDLARARDWFERHTRLGRSPADDAPDPAVPADLVA